MDFPIPYVAVATKQKGNVKAGVPNVSITSGPMALDTMVVPTAPPVDRATWPNDKVGKNTATLNDVRHGLNPTSPLAMVA